MTYKSTKIISKGLVLFGILTLVLILGFTMESCHKDYIMLRDSLQCKNKQEDQQE